jgi:hypothetical protein
MSGALATAREKASQSVKRAKRAVGIIPEEEKTALDEMADMCPQLTYQQRMIGFGTCFTIGWLISCMSFNFFEELIAGDPVPFVILYSVGNIISLLSASFLCGPKRQLKRMFDDKRKITTIVYLSALVLCIIVAFIPMPSTIKLTILVLLLFVQFCASLWYSLSYIPLARRAVKKCFKREFGGDDNV